MPELIQAYWPFILIAFVIGIAVAWFAFAASRKTSVTRVSTDVLDEDQGPAARNQALIDAPANSAGVEELPNTPEPETVTAPVVQPTPQSSSASDDLTQIKGLGPKIANMLGDMGVTSFAKIAAWDDAEIARVDGKLGRFQGRITRDNWVEQARHLSEGDQDAFADKFGNNG